MKKNQIIHFLKFSGASISATIFSNILFYFLTPVLCRFLPQTLADGLSTGICYILATIFCYVVNKLFVFKTKSKDIREAFKFFAVATPKMLITTFLVPVIILLVHTDLSLIKTLINLFVQTILFFAGYIFQKIWVFKDSPANTDSENS